MDSSLFSFDAETQRRERWKESPCALCPLTPANIQALGGPSKDLGPWQALKKLARGGQEWLCRKATLGWASHCWDCGLSLFPPPVPGWISFTC